MPRNEFELLKIESYVLKVNINCQGCINKVKKLLTKVEGVYAVNIDAEGERIIVSGIVDHFNGSVNQHSFGSEVAEGDWRIVSNHDQDSAMKAVAGKIDQNGGRKVYMYMGEDGHNYIWKWCCSLRFDDHSVPESYHFHEYDDAQCAMSI